MVCRFCTVLYTNCLSPWVCSWSCLLWQWKRKRRYRVSTFARSTIFHLQLRLTNGSFCPGFSKWGRIDIFGHLFYDDRHRKNRRKLLTWIWPDFKEKLGKDQRTHRHSLSLSIHSLLSVGSWSWSWSWSLHNYYDVLVSIVPLLTTWLWGVFYCRFTST